MIVAGWLITILVGVLPVAFGPGSTAVHALKWTLWAPTAGRVLLRVAKDGWQCRRWSLPVPRCLVLACAALLISQLVSSVAAANPRLALRAVAETACWTVLALTIAVVAREPRVAWRLMLTLVLGLVPAGLFGLGQMLGIPGVPVPSDGNLPGISTLGNQNYLAGLMAIGLWPSVTLWTGRPLRRLLAILATLVLMAALLMADAVGAILAAAGAGVMLAGASLLIRYRRVRLVVWWQAAILAGGLIATTAGSLLLVDDILGRSSTRVPVVHQLAARNSADARLTNWAVAVDMAVQRPVLGVGPEHYQLRWLDSRARLPVTHPDLRWAEHRPRATHVHNDYLQWVTETGLLGVVALIGVASCLLAGWRARWRESEFGPERRYDLWLDAGVLTALLHALVSFPLHLPANLTVLAVLIGLTAARTPLANGAISLRLGPWSRPVALLVAGMGLVLIVGAWREFSADLLLERGQKQLERGEAAATSTLQAGIERAIWPSGALYARAVIAFADDDLVGAEHWLQASLQEQPTFEAYLQLAELALVNGDLADAESRLAQIASCGPTVRHRLRTLLLQGRVHLARRQLEAAEERFEAALSLDPAYYPACLGIGTVAAMQGRVSVAEAAYQRAVQLIGEQLRAESTVIERRRLQDHMEIARRAVASLPR